MDIIATGEENDEDLGGLHAYRGRKGLTIRFSRGEADYGGREDCGGFISLDRLAMRRRATIENARLITFSMRQHE